MEEGGGVCHLPLPTTCITTPGEMQTVQSRSCRYLPAQTTWSSALALLQPSPPSVPAPHSQVSPASAPHPLYEKALSVPPVRAHQFQKKHPERRNYPAAVGTTVFPCYVRTDTQDLTHGERTTWATWSYILPDSSAAPPGLHPSLHKTGRVDKRSLSASHVHKKHTFVAEVTESSETWEWGQLMGSRLRKGLANQKQFLPQ